MFIDGQCEAQSTAATGTYTFDAAACTTGTVPALGTEFKLVVQEYNTVNLATDYEVKVTCNLDSICVTEVVNLGTSGEDIGVTDTTPIVGTTVDFQYNTGTTTTTGNDVDFQDNTGTTTTTGNVGDSVQSVTDAPTKKKKPKKKKKPTPAVTRAPKMKKPKKKKKQKKY